MRRRKSRRAFLGLLGLGAAGLAGACREGTAGPREAGLAPGLANPTPTVPPPTSTSTPTPTPTPLPTATPTPRAAGLEVRALLPGTEWETSAYIQSSGGSGPVLMVLGGVHGNEPAGWYAADQIAGWTPEAGVLIVIPRANVKAIDGFERLVENEGDLNRQYPGDPDSDTAMSRMAAEITGLARELHVEVLLDLHESWAFYIDREAHGFESRSQAGTAYLGQTITSGHGPLANGLATDIAGIVNESIPTEREQFIPRDRWSFGGGAATMSGRPRGRSSLSLGGHVPGLTPVLVETGQQGQALERRTELQFAVVRATIDILGM